MLTLDDRRTCAAFRYGLTILRIDDDGLAEQNSLRLLNVVARLAMQTKNLTKAGDSPEELLLHRLADLTVDLLATPWMGDGPAIVREWLIARSELFQLRIGAESW